jgi:hypothetical protein
MKTGMSGKITSECFLCTIEDDHFPTANEQFRTEGEFEIVGVAEDYIIVNFKGDDVDYFISEDEFENVEFLG